MQAVTSKDRQYWRISQIGKIDEKRPGYCDRQYILRRVEGQKVTCYVRRALA
jgi:hypothetical protein